MSYFCLFWDTVLIPTNISTQFLLQSLCVCVCVCVCVWRCMHLVVFHGMIVAMRFATPGESTGGRGRDKASVPSPVPLHCLVGCRPKTVHQLPGASFF